MAPEDELLLELLDELLDELLVALLLEPPDLPLPQPAINALPSRPAKITSIFIINISPKWFHPR